MSYRDWHPRIGEYVWWKDRVNRVDRLAQVRGEALGTNYDWWIASLDGEYPDESVMSYDLTPVADMQVVALIAAERLVRAWSAR